MKPAGFWPWKGDPRSLKKSRVKTRIKPVNLPGVSLPTKKRKRWKS